MAAGARCVGEVVDGVGGTLLRGARSMPVSGLSSPALAAPTDVVVALDRDGARALAFRPVALAIVGPRHHAPSSAWPAAAVLAVEDARLALVRVTALWAPPRPVAGIHPSAVIDSAAEVDASAHVGALAVIEAGAVVEREAIVEAGAHVGAGAYVGPRSWLRPRAVVAAGCRIGARCLLQPGAVVGADGFGFASLSPTRHLRIEHLGIAVLEDDVELGANACVDRATLGATRIGRGTKIDNLVQVAHNVQIGPGVRIVAQSGVAGSTTIGAGAILAAQSGVAGHVRVGAEARVYGQAGVRADVGAGEHVAGSPAEPKIRYFRRTVALRELERLEKRVRALEAALDERKRE